MKQPIEQLNNAEQKDVPVAQRREFEGDVVRANGQKTVHVAVRRVMMEPKYRKQYSRTNTYAVHDEKGVAKEGDHVRFVECRPISKTKRWRLVEVIK